ncbi:MAG TPA: PilZ domain-containing protein [Burkholderiaceae bacterium]
MRQFIRHPVDVPVEIRIDRDSAGAAQAHTQDISLGGLAVHSSEPVAPGSMIEVRIPYVEPAFQARATVAWCRPRRDGPGHEVGVSFLDAQDVFLARMVTQICYIEDYRKSIAREEGRELSSEEAAGEWIAKYAATFPGAASGGLH